MRRPAAGVLVILIVAAWAAVGSGPAAAGTPVPGAASCPIFPADNVWNTDISSLPVGPHSAAWLASMDASTTNLHPDFGPSFGAQPVPYGIPYTVVNDSVPKVPVAFQYASESDPGPYPFGASTPIEGGQDATGDRHAIMVDASSCTLYELYDAQYSATGSTAGSGAIWSLTSNALRPAGWTSADAAGLPILPGLVRLDEVEAGSVTHAIRFTAARTDQAYLWPARHQAGSANDPNLPPMGARFRLKASVALSGYLPETQVILRAMQHYGLILADNGSNWYFQGTDDSGWPNAVLDQLKSIPASDFEAVDESSLMISADSGQARQPGSLPVTPATTAPPRPVTSSAPKPASPKPASPKPASSPTPARTPSPAAPATSPPAPLLSPSIAVAAPASIPASPTPLAGPGAHGPRRSGSPAAAAGIAGAGVLALLIAAAAWLGLRRRARRTAGR